MAKSYQQGCAEVVQLGERLTLEEIEIARPSLMGASDARLPQVIVDLRRLRVIDSAGLELLCDARDRCMRQGGELRLAAPSPLLHEVLRVTGLDRECGVYPDIVTAAGDSLS